MLQSLRYDTWSKKDIADPAEYIWGEELLRKVLEGFGYRIAFSKATADSKHPLIMLHRNDNGEYFSVYAPDMTVETRLRFPLGAPLLMNQNVELQNGEAIYHFPKAVHSECRVYVEQESGVVIAKEKAPVSMKFRRRIGVSGLKNATVRFFGEEYCKENITAYLNAEPDLYKSEDPFEMELIRSPEYGTYYEVRNVTGSMLFSMPFPES